MELTKTQERRIARNTAIIERYLSMSGAKTAIIDKIAKEFELSVPTIRGILVRARCIGQNAVA